MPVSENLLALLAGGLQGYGQKQQRGAEQERWQAEQAMRGQQLGMQERRLGMEEEKWETLEAQRLGFQQDYGAIASSPEWATMPPSDKINALAPLLAKYPLRATELQRQLQGMMPGAPQRPMAIGEDIPGIYQPGAGFEPSPYYVEPGARAAARPGKLGATLFGAPKDEFKFHWDLITKFVPNALAAESLPGPGVDPFAQLAMVLKSKPRELPPDLEEEYKYSVQYIKNALESHRTNTSVGAGAEPLYGTFDEGGFRRQQGP